MTDFSGPLAAKLRPHSLDQFVGQTHLMGPGKPLWQIFNTGLLHSMIFWGPPGTGKTTLARLLAQASQAEFIALSAVMVGLKEIRAAMQQALELKQQNRNTVLFIDEVHRFNKSQQDAFLPYIEEGTITFIGATTENPSFELNNALLSRCRVYVLKPLTEENLSQIIDRALQDADQHLGLKNITFTTENKSHLAKMADGDARQVLNILEIIFNHLKCLENTQDEYTIDETLLTQALSGNLRRFDKKGESFYDQISALHKSVRGSCPDAALYWFARMLDGGCDPLYIARRMVRMASEDIGNADPTALNLALNAWDTQERLGSPEGELALAQALVYLAVAPKSNAVYTAFQAAQKDAKLNSLEVPLHLRNAPTQLMQNLNYGKEYRYDHEEQDGFAAGQHYFPEKLGEKKYYHPVARGLETKIAEKLKRLDELKQAYLNSKSSKQ